MPRSRVVVPRDGRDGVERRDSLGVRCARRSAGQRGTTRFQAWCAQYEWLYRSVRRDGRRSPRRSHQVSMRHDMTAAWLNSDHPVRVVVSPWSHLGLGRRRAPDARVASTAAWNRMGARAGHLPLDEHESVWGDRVRALGYPLSIVHRTGGFDVGRCLELRRTAPTGRGGRGSRRQLVRERLLRAGKASTGAHHQQYS